MYLIFGYSNFEHVEPGAFSCFKNLHWLSIADNPRLASLNENTFLGMQNLGTLVVNRTNLGYLPKLNGLSGLGFLDLTDNKISGIDPNAFGHMKKMGVLYLSGNRLKHFELSWIKGLRKLEHFNVYKNPSLKRK